MEIVIALVFAGAVLFGADRLLLWLESRGHVNWRRKGRRDLSKEPRTELDDIFSDTSFRDESFGDESSLRDKSLRDKTKR
ncbi:hypothetical protein ACIBHY_51195 [Nonomuraea sp. NPDC050547]|uniref:hypothetical protein n=1 Tax=Nonomuraea sp. NPDC050547 TaxID=3364368 RepID=UPI00379CABAD